MTVATGRRGRRTRAGRGARGLAAPLPRRGGTEYTLLFQNAGQLVTDDDVQVGGRRVGSVREIELTDDNQAAIKVVVEEPYAPLREGTQAVIRLTSLSGIANRYIALTPAPGDAEELPDGATLTDRVDHRRRRPRPDLQHARRARRAATWPTSSRASPPSTRARASEAGESAKYFNPLLSTSRRLVQRADRGRGGADRASSSTPRAP